jgi:hypothetical protein
LVRRTASGGGAAALSGSDHIAWRPGLLLASVTFRFRANAGQVVTMGLTLADVLSLRAAVLASTLVAVPASLMSAAPAHADYSAVGSVSASNAVLYEGCHDIPYALNLRTTLGDSWSIDVSLLGPDGLEVSGDFVYSDSPTPDGLQVCGNLHNPGRYTITAIGEYYDTSSGRTSKFDLDPTQISVREPVSTVAAKAASKRVKKGRTVKVTARVRDERPNGRFPTSYAKVRLEEKRKGRWVWLRGSVEYTNQAGKATLDYRGTGKKRQLRVAVLSNGIYSGSTSKAITLKKR